MRATIGTLIILIFSQTVHSRAGDRLITHLNAQMDFKCKAIFEEDSANFYFMGEADRYSNGIEWNKETRSAIEYSWLVFFNKHIVLNDVDYEGFDIGVRYFSQSAIKEYGGLSDIFKLSEVSSFGYTNKSFIPIRFSAEELFVGIENQDVVLTVKRLPNTSFIFDSDIGQANFWVINDGQKARRCSTVIKRSNRP